MCFVWIWEQTAITSLYSINWLVFITETECVYCAVRTGTLNEIQDNFTWCLFQTSFRHSNVFTFIIFLSEGRAGEAWELSNKLFFSFPLPPRKKSPLLPPVFPLLTLFCRISTLTIPLFNLYTGLTDILDFEGAAWFLIRQVCVCDRFLNSSKAHDLT